MVYTVDQNCWQMLESMVAQLLTTFPREYVQVALNIAQQVGLGAMWPARGREG